MKVVESGKDLVEIDPRLEEIVERMLGKYVVKMLTFVWCFNMDNAC